MKIRSQQNGSVTGLLFRHENEKTGLLRTKIERLPFLEKEKYLLHPEGDALTHMTQHISLASDAINVLM